MRMPSVCNRRRQIVSFCAATAILLATAAQMGSQTAPIYRDYPIPSALGSTQSNAYGGGCPAAYEPGTYGFIGLGQELASNPFGEPTGPIASLLVVQSNGDGTLAVQRTDFADGVLIVTPTASGSYTVGDDCTVTDTIPVSGSGLALTGYGVIVQDGAEVDYMATTPGVVIQNYVGRRMPQHCTNATLNGAYGFSGSGTMLPLNSWGSPSGPLMRIGALYFDAVGNFRKENEQAFINGSQLTDQRAPIQSVRIAA